MKTIMLSDEAYRKLAALKGNKSFTELVIDIADRLKGTKSDSIMKFAGIISDDEANELQKIVRKVRKSTIVSL